MLIDVVTTVYVNQHISIIIIPRRLSVLYIMLCLLFWFGVKSGLLHPSWLAKALSSSERVIIPWKSLMFYCLTLCLYAHFCNALYSAGLCTFSTNKYYNNNGFNTHISVKTNEVFVRLYYIKMTTKKLKVLALLRMKWSPHTRLVLDGCQPSRLTAATHLALRLGSDGNL